MSSKDALTANKVYLNNVFLEFFFMLFISALLEIIVAKKVACYNSTNICSAYYLFNLLLI